MKKINGQLILTLGLSALVAAAMVACTGEVVETSDIKQSKALQNGGGKPGKDCITIEGGAPESSKIDTLIDCGDDVDGDGSDSTSVSHNNKGGGVLPVGNGGAVDTTGDCGSSKGSDGKVASCDHDGSGGFGDDDVPAP